jgi:hypothetical protein
LPTRQNLAAQKYNSEWKSGGNGRVALPRNLESARRGSAALPNKKKKAGHYSGLPSTEHTLFKNFSQTSGCEPLSDAAPQTFALPHTRKLHFCITTTKRH